MYHRKIVSGLLRIGIAFAFLYPAIDSFFHPGTWIGFFPAWLIAVGPVDIFALSIAFSVVEIIIAALILFQRDPTYPAIAAAAVLGAIVVFDLSAFDIVFRDISIFLMALALIFLHKR